MMTKHTILPKTAVLAVLCVLLATPLTVFSQQKSAVPTEHNRALDEKFLKFYDTEEEKRDVSALLSKNYNRYGSYLGSAIIQQYIDLNIFLEFLDGNIEILKRFDGKYNSALSEYSGLSYYDAAKSMLTPELKEKLDFINDNFGEWLKNNYFNIYSGIFNTDHPPDYNEMIEMCYKLDPDINNLEFYQGKKMFNWFNPAEIVESSARDFKNGNHSNFEKEMYVISNEAHFANYMLFSNILKICFDTSKEDNFDLDNQFHLYMQVVEPKLN